MNILRINLGFSNTLFIGSTLGGNQGVLPYVLNEGLCQFIEVFFPSVFIFLKILLFATAYRSVNLV